MSTNFLTKGNIFLIRIELAYLLSIRETILKQVYHIDQTTKNHHDNVSFNYTFTKGTSLVWAFRSLSLLILFCTQNVKKEM